MLKKHNKLIVLIIICTTLIIIVLVFISSKNATPPSGKIKNLELKNPKTVELNIYKWYGENNVTINDNNTIDKLISYLNSLELIQLEQLGYSKRQGNSYALYVADDIVICGEYIRIHKDNDDDCVYTEYYITNSKFNPITGNSKVSNFLDELINEGKEQ